MVLQMCQGFLFIITQQAELLIYSERLIFDRVYFTNANMKEHIFIF